MALQGASFLPSALCTRNEGKTSYRLKDSALMGILLSNHSFKNPLGQTKLLNAKGRIRAQSTATASPEINMIAPEKKKTLRKGNVLITGASSGLGLATAMALAETGHWNVIMACRDFLKAEKAAKSTGDAEGELQHHAPRPGLPQQCPPVCAQFPTLWERT
ncbi:hypothetical protein HPP92_007083 [Vanilla planifolia]|uniref:Protochlorophyllide reductase n=1 Tax=Vanilla planifolia TaxID=51239 RepID=A0A835RDF5_VANPL|nr:hypothetical protein HPP92_007083 [Vanilla planifolia]